MDTSGTLPLMFIQSENRMVKGFILIVGTEIRTVDFRLNKES